MKVHILCLILLCAIGASAQTIEEFQKQEQARIKQFSQKQKEGSERLQQEYINFVTKQDKEWTEYLKKEWKNYSVFVGKKAPQKPKPIEIPVYIPQDTIARIPQILPDAPPTIQPIEEPEIIIREIVPPLVEPIRIPAKVVSQSPSIKINFYGSEFSIPFDEKMLQTKTSQANQEAITSFWAKTDKTNYSLTIDNLLKTKAELNINDFGYFLLVSQFAQSLYSENVNTQRLMTWFIMVRSGYGVRIAYHEAEIVLLVPSLQQIYQNNYMTVAGINYYIFPNTEETTFYTYDKDYGTAGKFVSVNIDFPINFRGNKSVKELSFDFEGKLYQIQVSYDPDLINFYKDYPMTELQVYFNAPVSAQAQESIAAALKPFTNAMEEIEAVNFLLQFVQTAFEYKTDPEQFGREKFFFAEELFYYPYCDCEDRSVLFSYLVREILGLKVVGLEYPNHVATAVALTNDHTGDFLELGNDRYFIADPTYVNAPTGMTMPRYKSTSPILHKIKNQRAEELSVNNVWQLVEKAGCRRGSNQKNSEILTDESVLLTGYFSGSAQLDTFLLDGNSNGHTCFISKTSNKGKTLWAKAINATENAVGLSLTVSPNENIYVAGVFSGAIQCEKTNLKASDGNTDLFVACFSSSGNFKWISQGGLNSIPQDPGTAFSVKFDARGQKQELKYAIQYEDDKQKGLFADTDGGVLFTGMAENTMAVAGGIKSNNYSSSEMMDITELLYSENEKLIEEKADQSIAGLLAAIRLVKDMGVSFTGEQTQQALNKHNPDFRKRCPNIYKNLGRINFVKNKSGIITIQTANGKDIYFDKVSISNNSTISVSDLPSGNLKIDILSGVQVGKLVIWYNLNYIKIYSQNGNLLFDYAPSHSQAKVNIRKDILN